MQSAYFFYLMHTYLIRFNEFKYTVTVIDLTTYNFIQIGQVLQN